MNVMLTIWLKNTYMNIPTTATLMPTVRTQKDPSTARVLMVTLVME